MKITIEPMYARVVARRLVPSDKTDGGIIIPEVSRVEHQEAEVVAVGPGKPTDEGTFVPVGLKPGDHIIFEGGKDIVLNRERFVLLTPSDIFGKVIRTPDPDPVPPQAS